MKMLVRRTAGGAALPFTLADLKQHMRVSDASEDSAIENIGLTAAAEIEQFAQIALLTQTVVVTIYDPQSADGLSLPIGPLNEGDTPTVTIDGTPSTAFDVVPGLRPYLRWHDAFRSLCPTLIKIEYQAGFGASADDVPADLAQALMDQAALHYDGRSPMDAKSLTTSPHMARIGARYRGVQL